MGMRTEGGERWWVGSEGEGGGERGKWAVGEGRGRGGEGRREEGRGRKKGRKRVGIIRQLGYAIA